MVSKRCTHGASPGAAAKIADLLDRVCQTIALYRSAGLDSVDCSIQSLEIIGKWSGNAIASTSDGCLKCPLYAPGVLGLEGAGAFGAKVMFVSGFPSREAMLSRDPFAGEHGELLSRIVSAMGLERGEVYVTHAVRCRPPGGRLPDDSETAACRRLLLEEVMSVKPVVICTMGEFATRAVLGERKPFYALRGRFHERFGTRVMPTWHMADMMASIPRKRESWEDFQKIMRVV